MLCTLCLTPALQQKQAGGHLQVVHQPMIRFPAQELMLPDRLILLTKPRLALRESISQLDFHEPAIHRLRTGPVLTAVLKKVTPFKLIKINSTVSTARNS